MRAFTTLQECAVMPADSLQRVRVWDLPTRLFHWAVALCVVGLFITGKVGGAAMVWHSWLGFSVTSLLLFRVAWGMMGGHWSRFATFSYSPRTVLDYVRGKTGPALAVGHNPLGAGSVYALLLILAAQAGTGLFSTDGEDFFGPLNILVSNSAARLLTAYHKDVGEPALVALVLLHLGAIAYYRLRKGQDLVGPMLHGDKQLGFTAPASRDDASSRLLALLLLGLCSAAVALLVSLGSR
jgi:cytochrome b